MAYNAGILLGRIIKISGFEGALSVKLEKYFIENLPQMESVFVETDGRPVPFFIEYADYPGGDLVRIKFDDYDSDASVRRFNGCRIYLTSGNEEAEAEFNISELLDYSIVAANNAVIGKVVDVIENNGQLLLEVATDSGSKKLIPLHEDFVVSSDNERKILVLNLPDGLLELN
jgi:16S rRNA processing protein RimM